MVQNVLADMSGYNPNSGTEPTSGLEAMNGYDSTDKHFQRLTEVVSYSYRMQKVHRDLHQTLIRHHMGEYYPLREGASGIETTINLISIALRAMSRDLISKAPRILVNTTNPQNKSMMEDAEIDTNERIIKSDLAPILREVVNQSMISFGMFYLGADYVGNNKGMTLELVMDSIDRADSVYDIESTTLEKSDYQGHKFRMKMIDVLGHPWFSNDKYKVESNMAGGYQETDRTNFLSLRGSRSDLYDYVDIWFMFDRSRNKIYYYPVEQPGLKLAEMDWGGPKQGPYRYLYYEKPANHAIPISPMMHLLKKHRAFNVLDAKAIDQQHTAKGILFYTSASKSDAERIVNAYNNQSVLQEGGAVQYQQIGGAAPDTVSMAALQRADFSYQAGNMDQYAGLTSQAETLGQERLLSGASNKMLEDMQGHAGTFIQGVGEDIFWYDLRDPDENERIFEKPLIGTNETYPSTPWTKEKRQFISEMEYTVDIEPFSYRMRSPEERLADILSTVQVYMGLVDQAMAQGITLDVDAIMSLIAKYRHLPEINDILIRNQDPSELMGMMGSGGQKQSNDMGTPRRYIRESQSDGAGKQQALYQMMGRGQQQQQAVA